MMSLRQSTSMLRRCFSVNTPAAAAAADPIQVRERSPLSSLSVQNCIILCILLLQNLFAEKIREYGEKKASAGGKLVEASEKTLADLQAELDKVETLRNNLLPNLIFFAGCQELRRRSRCRHDFLP